MVADPGGPDPHGISTAPRAWTNLHRVVGYIFAAIYIFLLTRMIPRIWLYEEEFTTYALLHALLGLSIAPVFATKVLIIRKFQRLGKRLPLLGFTIAMLALFALGLVSDPSAKLSGVLDPRNLTELEEAGRLIVVQKCTQCHGASVVLGERRDRDDWHDIFEDMQENVEDSSNRMPLFDREERAVVAYLYSIAGERKD